MFSTHTELWLVYNFFTLIWELNGFRFDTSNNPIEGGSRAARTNRQSHRGRGQRTGLDPKFGQKSQNHQKEPIIGSQYMSRFQPSTSEFIKIRTRIIIIKESNFPVGLGSLGPLRTTNLLPLLQFCYYPTALARSTRALCSHHHVRRSRDAACRSKSGSGGERCETRVGWGISFEMLLSRSCGSGRAFLRTFAAKAKTSAAPTEKKAPVVRVIPPPAQPANPPPVAYDSMQIFIYLCAI